MGHMILFQDSGFKGEHTHVVDSIEDLSQRNWNDKISSVIILSGTWKFYRDAGFKTGYPGRYTKGAVAKMEDWGIPNHKISAIKLVSDE